MTRLLFLLCLLPGCFATCDGTDTPSSETCEPGAPRGVVTEVDLGRYLDGEFTAYQDEDVVPLIWGGQGSPMLVFNLRLRGSDLPECMPQLTRIRNDSGEAESGEQAALVTRQVLPDTWITGDLLIVTYDAYPGSHVTAESFVGDASEMVGLWIDYVGTLPDAAVVPDAASPDATVAPDASPADAAP